MIIITITIKIIHKRAHIKKEREREGRKENQSKVK